ncbi:MAG TPA: penicillin acylase family protein [Thermoleophilaceae bacterium]|nr:penicillin acylase family protein [Thermoleophilaceae bacterium]
MGRALATAACLLVLAAPAAAEVRRAESVMPPGQSGFISVPCLAATTQEGHSGVAPCDPHLTDQIGLFTSFDYKDAMLGGSGAEQTPRAGVRIVRDAYGVPSIYGDTEADMWWGAGYAVAQDRLFQIEAFRRATTGTLAEILGRGALEDDIVARRDYYTEAERMQMIEALPGDLRSRWQAYADGVNAWIDEVTTDPSKLPAEFAALGAAPEPLQVHEMAAIGVFLARTTPSDDGEELANLEGFQAVGAKAFDRVFPLRTPGQWGTVPRSEGLFPSRPGRTRKQERRAFKRSAKYARGLPLPSEEAEAAGSGLADRFVPDLGGSKMWAIRKGKRAWLLTGPQLGFNIPERLVELELHSPTLDVRGVTAAGVPVMGIGHNEDVAWGVTSGLGDEDDLYAEQLVGDEGYRFRGETRTMQCRDEEFSYRPPPTDFLALLDLELPDTSSGTHVERICRTLHGPVQEVIAGEGIAYARRYAIWGREVGTIVGLDRINRAGSIQEVDVAADQLTWNENLMAADDLGNIGFWNPGLLPLRSKRWDERLPFPGTGGAEWAGLLKPRQRPQVINPEQGWLANWNNPPSFGSTNGDGPAKERTIGGFHRGKYLARVVKRFVRKPSFEALTEIDRISGTHAQQRVLAGRKLRRAAKGAKGDAKVVFDAIRAWNGDYATTDSAGKVPPGVAAWDAFCAAAREVATARYPEGVGRLGHGAGGSHLQECSTLEAFGLRTLGRGGYRRAAADAMVMLDEEFGSKDPEAWKTDRPTYSTGSEGAGGIPEPFPFFDRGTWTELTELGP